MLDDHQRASRYFAQTGRSKLTDRQQRRIRRKRKHQSTEAQDRRDSAIRDRIVALAARRRRRDLLPV